VEEPDPLMVRKMRQKKPAVNKFVRRIISTSPPLVAQRGFRLDVADSLVRSGAFLSSFGKKISYLIIICQATALPTVKRHAKIGP
jgi:hypothetical protein